MRKFKIAIFAILGVVLMSVFSVEVLAATILSFTVTGNVGYYTTEIGAKVWGTHAYNNDGVSGQVTYCDFSGATSSSDYIFNVNGGEASYSNIVANIGDTQFDTINDTLTVCIFVTNEGDRYLIPQISTSVSDTSGQDYLDITTSMYYFDISNNQMDLYRKRLEAQTASSFLSIFQTEVTNNSYTTWTNNSAIDKTDTFAVEVTIALSSAVASNPGIVVDSSFDITISLVADVDYTSNNILSIYQKLNQTSPQWTKFGYNATLNATATKVESNSLSNLYTFLEDADANGNANISFGQDDYENAPVYRDIDLVNINIATGEPIGKLSDVNYNFEWFGRTVTLPAGTTLASGRELTTEETFEVDVYTYYPDMYIRRWIVGDEQRISISDQEFSGSVYIPGYYTATFEATQYNPDKSITNYNGGVYPRSYVFTHTPLVSDSTIYLSNNYGFGVSDNAKKKTTASQMLTWAHNLTLMWQSSSLDARYRKAGAQGENYTAHVYNILYLVKYANNNSQATVGKGNSSSFAIYNTSGVSVKTSNGTTIQTSGTGQGEANARYECEKGGGNIGVYDSSQKGTATYDSSNNYKLSATGFDAAGMNYGYNSTYTRGSDITGLYSHQFLTKNDGTKRRVMDGYVGSDGYTTVFCLGMANAWGNVSSWVFDSLALSNGSEIYVYEKFSDYTVPNGVNSSWYNNTTSAGFSYWDNELVNTRGYKKMSYASPLITPGTVYRHFGVTTDLSATGIEMLAAYPTKSSLTAGGTTYGMCDTFTSTGSSYSVYGVLRGGASNLGDDGGLFYYNCTFLATKDGKDVGIRVMLKN